MVCHESILPDRVSVVNSRQEKSPVLALVVSSSEAVRADSGYERVEVDGVAGVLRKAGRSKLDWELKRSISEPQRLIWKFKLHNSTVRVEMIFKNGVPSPVSIHVEPHDDDPIDPRVFAKLSLRWMLTDIQREMSEPFLRYLLTRNNDPGWQDPFIALPRTGRKGRPDIDFAVWADRYVTARNQTKGRPMKVLMAENPGFSNAAIKAILHKARGRGLLTKSEQGRAGGDLTKKAIDLLTTHNQTITSQGE